MANNDKIQGVRTELNIKSIGVALTLDGEKDKKSSIVIAYAVGNAPEDIKFTAMKLSKKQTYKREDFLSAICQAESIKNFTYNDFDGNEKDIYICRERDGVIYDFVDRDYTKNRVSDGFAEIESCNLYFNVEDFEIKQGSVFPVNVRDTVSPTKYEVNSPEYAVMNAYNACLLGKLFSEPEFQLELDDRKRVKFEVRSTPSRYVDLSTLFIKPDIIEGETFVDTYITEQMCVIDGVDMMKLSYKIKYRPSTHSYIAIRYM